MTYLGWWPGMEMLPRQDAFDDDQGERVYVHIDERTEPRDESAVCPLCGYHRDLHDDGDCPPAEMSGIALAQREPDWGKVAYNAIFDPLHDEHWDELHARQQDTWQMVADSVIGMWEQYRTATQLPSKLTDHVKTLAHLNSALDALDPGYVGCFERASIDTGRVNEVYEHILAAIDYLAEGRMT